MSLTGVWQYFNPFDIHGGLSSAPVTTSSAALQSYLIRVEGKLTEISQVRM